MSENTNGTITFWGATAEDVRCVAPISITRDTVQFRVDIDGNSGGSKHGGTVTFPGPVSIHSQEMSEGNGQFSGQVHGNKYSWQTNCSSFQGVHEVITLKWDGFGAR